MKIKDLLKELSVFNEEDEIIACFCDDFHDDRPDVEYNCDFTVEFDGIPYLNLKEIFKNIAPSYNIILEEWNHDTDHVHILFKGQPNTEISKFINAYKSASSRLIKKEFPQIKKSLWKEKFWSQSFCLLTTGGITVDIIKQYIKSQGNKNVK